MKTKSKEEGKPLIILDFDGTLAPIVSTPKHARATPYTLRKLQEFSKRADIIILTGRPRAFVKKQISNLRVRVIGIHGNREKSGWKKGAGLFLLAKRKFNPMKGIMVEKKPMGFAVHYRNVAKSMQGKIERSIRIFTKTANATVVEGRKCFEFLPLGAKKKSDVLLEIIRRNKGRCVLFIGDDQSDAEAVHRAKQHGNFIGILIKSNEVRAKGIRKINRRNLFSFMEDFIKKQEGVLAYD